MVDNSYDVLDGIERIVTALSRQSDDPQEQMTYFNGRSIKWGNYRYTFVVNIDYESDSDSDSDSNSKGKGGQR